MIMVCKAAFFLEAQVDYTVVDYEVKKAAIKRRMKRSFRER